MLSRSLRDLHNRDPHRRLGATPSIWIWSLLSWAAGGHRKLGCQERPTADLPSTGILRWSGPASIRWPHAFQIRSGHISEQSAGDGECKEAQFKAQNPTVLSLSLRHAVPPCFAFI